MGCPATTKPPQHYSAAAFTASLFYPQLFALARHPRTAPKHYTIHYPGRGPSGAPPPPLVHLLLPPPLFKFKEVLCLLHSLHQPP